MKSTQPTVFLVWEFSQEPNFDIGKTPTTNHPIFNPYVGDLLCTTHQHAQLRAIDTNYKTAKQHKAFLEAKPHPQTTFYRIESASANHLFAASQLGTEQRIEQRKPL